MGGLNAYSTTCPRSRSSWLAVHPLLQKLNSAAQNAQNRAPYERDTPVLLCILLPGACVFIFMYSRACRPSQEGPYDLDNGLVLLTRSRNAPTGMLLTVFENDLRMGAARWACSGHQQEVHACPTAYIWDYFAPSTTARATSTSAWCCQLTRGSTSQCAANARQSDLVGAQTHTIPRVEAVHFARRCQQSHSSD